MHLRRADLIPAQIIAAKRDGGILTESQIEFMVRGFSEDRVPDYQMSAFAMAICLQGMTTEETTSPIPKIRCAMRVG